MRLVIIGTSLVTLLLTAIAFILYERLVFRDSTVAKLTTVAEIIGTGITPAVFFTDKIYANEVLTILEIEKHIVSATVFKKGKLFSAYYRDPVYEEQNPPDIIEEGYRFGEDYLYYFHPITFDDEMLGTMCIQYELTEMQSRLTQYVMTLTGILVASFLIAFILSTRFQKIITEPILNLAHVAGVVSSKKDYSVRAKTQDGRDEIGILVEGFNKMLNQIEERDRNLENLVNERTRELRIALEDLRKLDEMKSDFLNTVSHELRTPLTSVLGFIRIIKKRLDDSILPRLEKTDEKTQMTIEQIKKDLDIILSEGHRITAMINNILDIAKMEEGELPWKVEPLSMADVIQQAVSATQVLLEQKGLRLIMNVEDECPKVVGDKDRLMQVVINLIANAVKYTDKGSIACQLTMVNHELVVSVIDTGMGIPKEEQSNLFSKFKQVGYQFLDERKGTGLGLAICKYIVEYHKGRIWVESEPGKGSHFSFSVPINHATGSSTEA